MGLGRYQLADSGVEEDTEANSQRLTTAVLTVLSVKPSTLLFALLPFSFPYTLSLKAGMMDASVTL